MRDSIQDTLEIASQMTLDRVCNEPTNIWLWIAIVEFVIIIAMLFIRKSNENNTFHKIKKETLTHDVDFGNIFDSAFNATQLHDKLIRKCHPDRFPNDPIKNKIADELSKEIGKNKTNIKKLRELQLEAKEKLNI